MRCDRRLFLLVPTREGAIDWGEPMSADVYRVYMDVVLMSVCGGLLVVLFSFLLWWFADLCDDSVNEGVDADMGVWSMCARRSPLVGSGRGFYL